MNWGSFSNFLAMGGYGLYVWSAYGVSFVLLAVEVLLLVRRTQGARRTSAQDRDETQA